MRNELENLRYSVFRPAVAAYYVIATLLLSVYIFFYQFFPLSYPANDIVLNSIVSFSALSVAFIASMISSHYGQEDQPGRVWQGIMIAGWMWFLGEIAWQIYAGYYGDVPTPSPADVFWVTGFLFFTSAFYHQYAILYPTRKDAIRTIAVGAWLLVLLVPALYLTFTNSFTIGLFIEFYYPFADLAIGIAGLALALVFRGGALMRPWIGLMIFGLSDLLYAWAEKTNVYAVSAENGNLLSLFIDTTYIAAYLILGVGFLGHWILLKYGVRKK
jgi:hypothetical protein